MPRNNSIFDQFSWNVWGVISRIAHYRIYTLRRIMQDLPPQTIYSVLIAYFRSLFITINNTIFFFCAWKTLVISNRLVDTMSLSQTENQHVNTQPIPICTWVHAHNIKCSSNCSIIKVLCFPLMEHWFCRNSALFVITLLSAWNYFDRVLWNCSHTVFHLSIFIH